MEVNKEEALRCLSIAQRHRNSSNLPSALKFAKKSVSLFETPEGLAMVTIVEREIESGGSSSASASAPSPAAAENGNGAKASGVEEHVTSAHSRPGHSTSQKASTATDEKSKKREYTQKQMDVVKRVKMCKHHEYYSILAIEKTCSENDVKKAYKKLALALHPDKNGAPGADEAFKMVSKAFQVLSDGNLRAAFDSNPHGDPTQRGGGMPSRSSHSAFGHGGHGGGFQGDLNPEDLFNMFFGGGGGMRGNGFGGANVFTFGGPGGFQQFGGPRQARRAAGPADTNASPLMALMPILILFAFALISVIPTLFGSEADADPHYSFTPSASYNVPRNTWQRNVEYFVDKDNWEKSSVWQSVPEERRGEDSRKAGLYSNKVRSFERGVENVYIRKLQEECQYFEAVKQQRVSELAGFFGFGADFDKIREVKAEKSPACVQLNKWGLQRQKTQGF